MIPILFSIKKLTLIQRFRFAYYAFLLRQIEIEYPYELGGTLVKDAGVCDNNRRASSCTNEATIYLEQPEFKIKYSKGNYYHLCKSCADKYIGTFNGENCNK